MTGKLAWKNIRRNTTRSVIFICAALFGIALAIFALNLMKSISGQRLEDAISLQTGHMQIHRSGFIDDNDVTIMLDNADDIIKQLNSVEEIEAISKRIVANGMIASPENSLVGEISGIEPQAESEVSALRHYLIEGTWFGAETHNPALIGRRMADRLNLELHSKFVVSLKNSYGELTGGAYRVAGIFKTPNAFFDESNALVRYDDLSKLTGATQPHEIVIKLSDGDMLHDVRQTVDQAAGMGNKVSDWKTLLPELHAFSGFTDMVGMLFTIIILLGLGFGLLNSMNMIVQERTREIGMLRAIGQSRSSVFFMLMQEAGLMMLIGSTAGILLGIGIVYIAATTGISLGDGFGTLGIRETIYPELHWGQLIMMIILASVLTLIISAIPASKVYKINLSVALKE